MRGPPGRLGGMTNPLIDSLTAVVSDRPGDVPLRLHLAELLIADGRGADAVPHLGVVLASEPTNEQLRELGLRVVPKA